MKERHFRQQGEQRGIGSGPIQLWDRPFQQGFGIMHHLRFLTSSEKISGYRDGVAQEKTRNDVNAIGQLAAVDNNLIRRTELFLLISHVVTVGSSYQKQDQLCYVLVGGHAAADRTQNMDQSFAAVEEEARPSAEDMNRIGYLWMPRQCCYISSMEDAEQWIAQVKPATWNIPTTSTKTTLLSTLELKADESKQKGRPEGKGSCRRGSRCYLLKAMGLLQAGEGSTGGGGRHLANISVQVLGLEVSEQAPSAAAGGQLAWTGAQEAHSAVTPLWLHMPGWHVKLLVNGLSMSTRLKIKLEVILASLAAQQKGHHGARCGGIKGQASELMIAYAHIWVYRSQAESIGRQSRAITGCFPDFFNLDSFSIPEAPCDLKYRLSWSREITACSHREHQLTNAENDTKLMLSICLVASTYGCGITEARECKDSLAEPKRRGEETRKPIQHCCNSSEGTETTFCHSFLSSSLIAVACPSLLCSQVPCPDILLPCQLFQAPQWDEKESPGGTASLPGLSRGHECVESSLQIRLYSAMAFVVSRGAAQVPSTLLSGPCCWFAEEEIKRESAEVSEVLPCQEERVESICGMDPRSIADMMLQEDETCPTGQVSAAVLKMVKASPSKGCAMTTTTPAHCPLSSSAELLASSDVSFETHKSSTAQSKPHKPHEKEKRFLTILSLSSAVSFSSPSLSWDSSNLL
ncbi:hypothetical protein Q9966_010983 [Columba livia]|nr:hypothetical protein Q9966_010983 [Columba livia]